MSETELNDFFQKQKDYIDNLLEVDKRIISLYTQNGDVILNKFIRNNFQINQNIIDYYKDLNRTILHSLCLIKPDEIETNLTQFRECLFFFYSKLQFIILNSPKTPCKIKVYRGIEKIRHTDSFKNVGFFSTSLLRDIAKKFLATDNGVVLNITIPKNTHCLYLFLRSVYPAEFEVLLPHNNIFSCDRFNLILDSQEEINHSLEEYKTDLLDTQPNYTPYSINDIVNNSTNQLGWSIYYPSKYHIIDSSNNLDLVVKYINKHKIKQIYVSTNLDLNFLDECPTIELLMLNKNIDYILPEFKIPIKYI